MFAALFFYLILSRLGELVLAERNRRWALAQGGWECDPRHYRLIITVHLLFYLSLWLEWRYRSRGWSSLWPIWIALLCGAQFLRLWTMMALGRYWNARIIVVPHMKPVMRGPYRVVRHPNYAAVILEFVAIPMLCGAHYTAVIFSLANAWILARRIPQEERALRQINGGDLPSLPRFIPRRASIRPSSEPTKQATGTNRD